MNRAASVALALLELCVVFATFDSDHAVANRRVAN
jgi:hypothetical protein